MDGEPWYKDGLRFQCQRCGNCCRGEPGTIAIAPEEAAAIARRLGVSEADFRHTYTCSLAGGGLSLREKPNGDCILYDPQQGCTVYADRPRQCRTWPFWEEVVRSPARWAEETQRCPGMNQGPLYSAAAIRRMSEDDGTRGNPARTTIVAPIVDRTRLTAPGPDREPIPVEFLVLHHTAGTLQSALDHPTDLASDASAHLVISPEGQIFELVPCWDGVAYPTRHCGASHWFDGARSWKNLDDLSIGIALVNGNGNLLPYTVPQYELLGEVVAHLRALYPALERAERVLGHEQVAGRRGKASPGRRFDWPRFFERCYPGQEAPHRPSACPSELAHALGPLVDLVPEDEGRAALFWRILNDTIETCTCLVWAQNETDRLPKEEKRRRPR